MGSASRRLQAPPAVELLLALARGGPIPDLSSGISTEISSALWDEALGLAERHGIAPLLHHDAQGGRLPGLPAAALRELRAARISELSREEKRAGALGRALSALEGEAGERPIAALLLKGAASARTLYPHPELRPRSDLDLLVAPGDRAAALERLEARGFRQHARTRGTREDEPGWHELTLVDPAAPGAQLDLHFALAQAARHRLDARRLLDSSVPAPALGAAARLLPPEEAALVCAHAIAIHELAVPLVSLCDLARLLPRCELPRLARLAREVRLLRALQVSTALLAQLGPAPEAGARAAPRVPFSLCGAPVDPALLAALSGLLGLSAPVRALLAAAAAGYDPLRPRLARSRQLWRKALFIDRPADAARFALGHALQGVGRALRRSRAPGPLAGGGAPD